MAPATRKSRATVVNRELIGQAKTLLQELPEKTKEDLSLREAVDHLQEEIKDAMARGYNYEDIAKLLSQQGIKISTLTLKNYVPSGKRQATKAKGKRTKKEAEEPPTSAMPLAESIAAPEVAEPFVPDPTEPASEPPAQSRGRRGRGKAAEAETPVAETTTTETEPKQQRPTRTRKSSAKDAPKPATTRGRKKVAAT